MNKLPNLPIQIVGRDNVSNLYDLLGSRPLVLALHRFFGCTLSQYELGNLIREYRSLENPGFDLVVGVQSYPAYIRSLQDRFDGVPVICDVEGELYKALGLGSAATPAGLRAAARLAQTGGRPDCDGVLRLIVLNSASLQLIPANVAAVRAAAGSAHPFAILPAVWMASAASVCAALLAAALLARVWRP